MRKGEKNQFKQSQTVSKKLMRPGKLKKKEHQCKSAVSCSYIFNVLSQLNTIRE